MSDRAPPPQSLLNSLPQRGELQRREPAPVHLWNPPLSGEMDMRIARDGTWYHEGEPIRRLALAQLFSTILRLDQDARYYLVTPVERWAIQVDDAPFIAVRLSVSGEGEQQQLLFHTSLEDEVPLDDEHPLRVELDPQSGEPSPYIRVRANLDALVSRTVFYELADLAVEAEVAGVQRIGVWSGGGFFPIDGAD
ncbi:DUF1285 domain-containing protein [Halopseudomonas aestusnigri]|uniref:Proteophosphoglycan n=1 Tax=Halopseudomonas aestusnigri TaxID=857252 RepID=A0AAQ1G7C1_9GAMM|nr:DUF1285 domain-containing protein [Halopseudomonas aestusnigri]OWL89401.1 proteophosphoglycan precursor [Halopseudomonas aestusnigri]SEG12629.1 hypothetical protein SAMN05216586_103285 [Halopseudomonas aestusnigri]